MDRLPKTLKVGGLKYKVNSTQKAAKALLDGHDAWGLTDRTKQTVTIDNDLLPDNARRVWLHELMHLAATPCGLDKEWGDQEENYVARLSYALHQVFNDNPAAVKFLCPTN